MSLSLARSADRYQGARIINVLPLSVATPTATAETAYTEFTQFRSFTFDSSDDASTMFLMLKGIPAHLDLRERLLIVNEENGEAVMSMIRNSGLEFTYERSFLPLSEVGANRRTRQRGLGHEDAQRTRPDRARICQHDQSAGPVRQRGDRAQPHKFRAPAGQRLLHGLALASARTSPRPAAAR